MVNDIQRKKQKKRKKRKLFIKLSIKIIKNKIQLMKNYKKTSILNNIIRI